MHDVVPDCSSDVENNRANAGGMEPFIALGAGLRILNLVQRFVGLAGWWGVLLPYFNDKRLPVAS